MSHEEEGKQHIAKRVSCKRKVSSLAVDNEGLHNQNVYKCSICSQSDQRPNQQAIVEELKAWTQNDLLSITTYLVMSNGELLMV